MENGFPKLNVASSASWMSGEKSPDDRPFFGSRWGKNTKKPPAGGGLVGVQSHFERVSGFEPGHCQRAQAVNVS